MKQSDNQLQQAYSGGPVVDLDFAIDLDFMVLKDLGFFAPLR